ncbi:uncharacterized protein TRIADDRAFT_56963 [Trichoplax adhaerens]|uniref:JmjC domain-containing protein n=1 Tax=Trichoplax adhaerens TaxID=10228 RepID=B3RX19_TRIAD|nr:hypothetical protein TRIADDRAFT_56963 [Trichoplax adhaerens]EDV25230.1 hypothetical protein TRIADDRAFT_56963 [Trichoplax adhaerens]|eukprot:XP_002113120.1 hypothetical protein TRIADDRAFT_56963 [Trichoplax adhaerens]
MNVRILSWTIFFLLSRHHLSAATDDYSLKIGHLKPFGEAGSKVEVQQIDGFPTMKTFFQDYWAKSKPFIMKGAAKSYPAFTLWSDDYFLSFPEASTVNIFAEVQKKENRTLQPKFPTFQEFIQRYNTTQEYMVDKVPKFLQKDLWMPSCIACDTIPHSNHVMWFSSGGTKSVLHFDGYENLNCLLRGSKQFIMIDRKYPNKGFIDKPRGTYSTVDVDRVDLNKFPTLANAEYHFAHMEAGDCIYIPLYWSHHVRSFGHNIAVNVWLEPKNATCIDLSGCQEAKKLTHYSCRRTGLKASLNTEKVVTKINFFIYLDEIFKVFDTNNDGKITSLEVENISQTDIDQLNQFYDHISSTKFEAIATGRVIDSGQDSAPTVKVSSTDQDEL